jgi:ATP-dependent Lon protease
MRLGDAPAALATWARAAALEPAGHAALKYFELLARPQAAGMAHATDAARLSAHTTASSIFALATGGGIGHVRMLEAVTIPGAPSIEFTGRVATTGQESAKAAYACVRSKAAILGLGDRAEKCKLHMHFAHADLEKDGPSAGLALALIAIGAIERRRLPPGLAATGAITIGGAVEPVGGIAEKLMGACLAGATKVLMPRANLFELRALPARVRKLITVVPVSSLEEALPHAFPEREFVYAPAAIDGPVEAAATKTPYRDMQLSNKELER